ncbi:hypothetical protein [Phenylobacterium sp.]|uniref:hypothetical protein n=1 Tax=Phenylobacterium sp. TaxID=1871053 RepID=UPI0025E66430|nr:hypothetical protein [Phenylobacterium sp.]
MIDRRMVLATVGAWFAAGGAARAGPAPHDLSGVWTNAWYTSLERRKAFKALVVTPAEAAAYEAPRRALHGEVASKEDVLGQNESEFPDQGPGLARIRGEIRSSWIVDPPDGQIPWTAAARVRLHLDKEPADDFDNVEARDTDERCLTGTGDSAPIVNTHDANVIEIVQTRDHVAIYTEKNHAVRIVRLGVAGPATHEPAEWPGASVGRWEGRTLVVETTHRRPGLTRISDELSLSDRSRVVEQFTRTGATEITYLFQVEDPTLFTRAWRGEMVFRPAEGPIYEYACHEGNYSLPSILSAARQADVAAAKGTR